MADMKTPFDILIDEMKKSDVPARNIAAKEIKDNHFAYAYMSVAYDEKVATIEAQQAEIKRLNSTIEFVKRWVQRVHDKETTLEEFYSVIRYDEVFKPVEAALAEGE